MVVLEDVMPSNLRRAEAEYSDASLRGGFGSLELASTVEDAVREADIAIDFVPDELESKLEIFSMIDRMAPPATILCTPSEALSITDLASCVYRPERALAVRGGLAAGADSVRLIYPVSADGVPVGADGVPVAADGVPAVADRVVVETVRRFLTSLGLEVVVEADQDEPALSKNRPQPAV
jgi:3-hydroxybutyryl-CoA dehydrogenase